MLELCLTAAGLGVGLAMDACAVSMANGLNEPHMKRGKSLLIAGTFGFFQALMPMTGWLCVNLLVQYFEVLSGVIPYVSLALLLFIGGKMLLDGIKSQPNDEQAEATTLTLTALLLQAVATSIDALSTGFAMEELANGVGEALLCSTIIAVVTFGISLLGIAIGKKFGDKLGSKAQIVGGIVLIAIGIEIFVKGVFF